MKTSDRALRVIVIPMGITLMSVVATVAGCSDTEGEGAAHADVSRATPLTGIVMQATPQPEDRSIFGIQVTNSTELLVTYGATLDRAERLVDDSWIDASEIIPVGAGRARLIEAAPGESVGPQVHGGFFDGVKLPPDAPRGSYRITRIAQTVEGGGEPSPIELVAELEVR